MEESMWPDRRAIDLLGIELPIIQAPMAGANGSAMAIAVSEAGGLGSLPCAMLDAAKVRAEIGVIRQQTDKPLNVNFFCHQPAARDPERDAAWKARLTAYYREFGLDEAADVPAVNRSPFDEAMCGIVEDLRPEVVSFHFGLPAKPLLDRVKATGAVVLSSATTVAEASWRTTAAMPSSPRATRPAATAACSSPTRSQRRRGPSRWSRRSSTRWASR
jgi:nitronate monooxygenase